MLQLSHKREQPPTRWVDLWEQQNYHPFTGQSFGVVFLYFDALFAKHKNECQQCKYEHSKSHKVFEIKMIIVHKHHLHSMQNRGKPPCNTVVLVNYNINSRKIQLYILKVIIMKRTLLQRSFCVISQPVIISINFINKSWSDHDQKKIRQKFVRSVNLQKYGFVRKQTI